MNQDMHEIGHDTFNARLLAKLLRASITDDFHQTLINKVPHSYHCDGTYLLWSIGNHIYRNNIAFSEHVREQIITMTLAAHNNDVLKYLLTIKNKLRMMTSLNPHHRHIMVSLFTSYANLNRHRLSPFRNTSEIFIFSFRKVNFPIKAHLPLLLPLKIASIFFNMLENGQIHLHPPMLTQWPYSPPAPMACPHPSKHTLIRSLINT